MDPSAYRQLAEKEEDHFWFRGRRAIFFPVLDRLIGARNDLRVCEIGCGAGGLLKRLTKYGPVLGIELDRDFAALALDRTELPILSGDACRLPLPDECMDLVCLFDTLEHIPDEHGALSEILRVLVPGGIAFFSVPAYQFLWSNNDRVAHHQRRYTKSGLAAAFDRAGLETLRLSYFNSFLFPLILPAVLLTKLKERIIGLRNEGHTNLSVRIPHVVNEVLARIMGSEGRILPRVSMPIGHSLLGAARKPPRAED